MSALVGDIVSERIDPRTATAACRAGSQLLRIVEIEHRYGRKAEAVPRGDRGLMLVEQP